MAASSPRPTQFQQAAIRVSVAWTRSNLSFNGSNVGACEPHPARVTKRRVSYDDRAQLEQQHALTQSTTTTTTTDNDNQVPGTFFLM